MMKKSLQTRFLSLILTLVLSFSLCPTALADLDPSDYSDLKEDYWAYDSIMYCSEWNIVTGFEDGTFRPEDEVTYAQFMAMLARTFYSDEVNAVTATAENPWYYPYMKVSRDHNLDFKTNIVNRGGWPEVVVANDPVNRYEMASILRMTMVAHGKSPSYEKWQSVTGAIKDYDQFPARDDVQIYDLSVPSCCYDPRPIMYCDYPDAGCHQRRNALHPAPAAHPARNPGADWNRQACQRSGRHRGERPGDFG